MSHVALTSTKPDALHADYQTVFDARPLDWIDETISGTKLRIRFLRVNERHHSLAVANVSTAPFRSCRMTALGVRLGYRGATSVESGLAELSVQR